MKKFKKVTLAMATIITSTSAWVGYDRHQQAAFAAANPLFEENIEAIADDGIWGDFMTLLFGDADKKRQEERDRFIQDHPTMVYGHKIDGSNCPSSGSSSSETESHTESSVNGNANGGVGTGGLWNGNLGASGGYQHSSNTKESNENSYSGNIEYECKKVDDEDALCDRCAAVKCDGSPRYPTICSTVTRN